MDVRYLDPEEKGRSRELWEECFPADSSRFLDYYYQEKCRDNRILVLEEERGGRILSMIQQNPYRVRGPFGECEVDYIVGVATAKDARRRGYMRRLLEAALKEERQRKMPFSFLMPADPKIYAPFGYVYVYDQPFWRWNAAGRQLRRETAPVETLLWGRCRANAGTGSGIEDDFGRLGGWIDQWLSCRYQIYALRTEAYMRRLWKEIESEYGELSLLYDGAELAGAECFWGGEKKERRFLYGKKEYVEEEREAKPAIMARIVDLPEFLKGIRLSEKRRLRLRLAVRDEILEENNGIFDWEIDGEGSQARRVSPEPGEEENAVSVSRLAGWLMGYAPAPEPWKAWEEAIVPYGGIFLDEVV